MLESVQLGAYQNQDSQWAWRLIYLAGIHESSGTPELSGFHTTHTQRRIQWTQLPEYGWSMNVLTQRPYLRTGPVFWEYAKDWTRVRETEKRRCAQGQLGTKDSEAYFYIRTHENLSDASWLPLAAVGVWPLDTYDLLIRRSPEIWSFTRWPRDGITTPQAGFWLPNRTAIAGSNNVGKIGAVIAYQWASGKASEIYLSL